MRGAWRVLVLGVLLALVVALPALLTAVGVTAPAVVGSAVGVAAIAGVFAALNAAQLSNLFAERRAQRHMVTDGCLTISGRLPRVERLADPNRLGVHAARRRPGESGPPTYVPRDLDDRLRDLVLAGGFVLLAGDSTAGKSRAAFEAIRTVLPNHTLIAPQDRTALAKVMDTIADLPHVVVWLDNLEQFLGQDGLTRTRVARLLDGTHKHRLILATIRTTELDAYSEDETARRLNTETLSTLEQATHVTVQRLFTIAEQRRAATLTDDPLIADALARAGEFGIPEYLAAGPELLDLWQHAQQTGAHRRGAALVAAAIDARRAGLTGPLPRDLIANLHEIYMTARGRITTPPDDLNTAWAWATATRTTTALLTTTSQPDTVTVFDYLVDHTERAATPSNRVPDAVLIAVLEHADADDASRIGATAARYALYPIALNAFALSVQKRTRTLGSEHPFTLNSRNNLAIVLKELGRLEEAEAEHRTVLEASTRILGPEHPSTLTSRNNHALVLKELGRLEEAEAEHRTVLEASTQVLGPEHPSTLTSRSNHALGLKDLGRLEEAEAEHRTVLEASTRVLGPEHPDTLISRNNLATVLKDLGRLEEAEAEHRTALEASTRILGPEHPFTLARRNSHAEVLRTLANRDGIEAPSP
jgi:tetratricopeptide (TPR) repeat protein